MDIFRNNPIEDIYGVSDILKPSSTPKNIKTNTSALSLTTSQKISANDLETLKTVVSACNRCPLSSSRTNTVFGEGNHNARLMFIGEGPGADEDASGRPFVGRAGQLLTKMINAMGLTRDDVYIANIVKCRPPGNRNPSPEEAAACIDYLKEQIKFIKPEFIVCLGSVAVTYLFGESVKITQVRGTWRDFEGCKVMLSYHPAFLLRSPDRKKEAWIDLQLVMRAMADK